MKALRTGRGSGGDVGGGDVLSTYLKSGSSFLVQVLLAVPEVGLWLMVWLWHKMEQLLGIPGILWLLWLLLVIGILSFDVK